MQEFACLLSAHVIEKFPHFAFLLAEPFFQPPIKGADLLVFLFSNLLGGKKGFLQGIHCAEPVYPRDFCLQDGGVFPVSHTILAPASQKGQDP